MEIEKILSFHLCYPNDTMQQKCCGFNMNILKIAFLVIFCYNTNSSEIQPVQSDDSEKGYMAIVLSNDPIKFKDYVFVTKNGMEDWTVYVETQRIQTIDGLEQALVPWRSVFLVNPECSAFDYIRALVDPNNHLPFGRAAFLRRGEYSYEDYKAICFSLIFFSFMHNVAIAH